MSEEKPLVSIFTTCKNAEYYLAETLESITSQSYKNIEIVIADGNSTDQTINILKNLSSNDHRIKFHSEPDADASEGFFKALRMAKGKYIMMLPISDLYLSKNWIKRCVDILESKPQVSLVHGCPANIDEESSIINIPVFDWLKKPLPSLVDFTAYYYATFSYISELTYCVRRDVYLKCFPTGACNFPQEDTKVITSPNPDPFLWFLLIFFRSGYLAYYLPIVASGGRLHNNSRNNKFKKYIKAITYKYSSEAKIARNRALFFTNELIFLDSNSKPWAAISGFNLVKFRLKIIYYRLAFYPMFGPRYNVMFIVTSLFRFFFEKPKDLTFIIFKKVRAKF